MPKVLVTDASERVALAVIRSLGRMGIEVVAADSISFNAGFLSKHCSRRIIYPLPQKNKNKFVESILHLVKNENFDLLIPVTDFTMIPLLERRDEIVDYVEVAAPPYETAIKTLDKAKTIKIAEEHGIPCPKTLLIEDLEALKEIAKDLQYPVVIKPRMKTLWIGESAVALKVTGRNYAYNREDLMAKYAKIMSLFDGFCVPHSFFLIQEFTQGEGYGVEVLMHDSELKAIFMHRRLREYPIRGGASTLRVSVRNEKLANYAIDLLNAMDWQGVAMVEFKMDQKSRDVKLMEVNGRFWGSLPLAINAGVDFPYLLFKCIVGEDNFSAPNYALGVKQRWLIPGDALWLYSSIVNGGKILDLIKEFMASFTIPDDIISPNDLVPILGAMRTSISSFVDVVKGRRNMAGEILQRTWQ